MTSAMLAPSLMSRLMLLLQYCLMMCGALSRAIKFSLCSYDVVARFAALSVGFICSL